MRWLQKCFSFPTPGIWGAGWGWGHLRRESVGVSLRWQVEGSHRPGPTSGAGPTPGVSQPGSQAPEWELVPFLGCSLSFSWPLPLLFLSSPVLSPKGDCPHPPLHLPAHREPGSGETGLRSQSGPQASGKEVATTLKAVIRVSQLASWWLLAEKAGCGAGELGGPATPRE